MHKHTHAHTRTHTQIHTPYTNKQQQFEPNSRKKGATEADLKQWFGTRSKFGDARILKFGAILNKFAGFDKKRDEEAFEHDWQQAIRLRCACEEYLFIYACMYLCMYVLCMCVCTYVHTHTHTYIRIYIHTEKKLVGTSTNHCLHCAKGLHAYITGV
jgi:hypothetical protein